MTAPVLLQNTITLFLLSRTAVYILLGDSTSSRPDLPSSLRLCVGTRAWLGSGRGAVGSGAPPPPHSLDRPEYTVLTTAPASWAAPPPGPALSLYCRNGSEPQVMKTGAVRTGRWRVSTTPPRMVRAE